MAVLIDSSILIEAERGKLDIEGYVAARQDERFFISVVSASELLHGVHRASSSAIGAPRSAYVEAVIARFPMLPIDLQTARMHARLWAHLRSAGALIGAHDLWLAATCLTHGLAIVTANVREFRRVPDLVVEVWSGSPSQ
ncbi:MAG: type II toxin-antitoxin system VapC family toxin [Armatimonadetes bacterium]|nr:type II toxin-antitoxin system VapC family toxin [Armatimonadota bacterium]